MTYPQLVIRPGGLSDIALGDVVLHFAARGARCCRCDSQLELERCAGAARLVCPCGAGVEIRLRVADVVPIDSARE